MRITEKINCTVNNQALLIFTFVGLLILISCSGEESSVGPEDEEVEIAEVVIKPKNVAFEVGEEYDFSAFLISASGDTVNDKFEIDWNWYSSDPDVFTVESGGTATGHNSGEAHCIVEVSTDNSKIVAKRRFVGRDSAFVTLLK